MYTLRPSTRGFTLIELLVVIAIIGILASVVLASLNASREKARDVTRVSQLVEIKKALEIYFIDNGEYPDNGSPGGGTPLTRSGGSAASPNDLADRLTPDYISSLPPDPNGNQYSYVRRVTPPGYAIRVDFEDNDRPGTDANGVCKTGINVLSGWWGASVPECEGF